MSEVIPLVCPVCGKKPKVIRDYSYEASGYGAWCIIQCKPLFRKSHMRVECGKASWEGAYKEATMIWNKECTEYERRLK